MQLQAVIKMQRMKGMIVYRILSFFVNLFAVLLAVSLLPVISMALASPPVAMMAFLMVGVILYAWYSNVFFSIVIIRKEQFTRRKKDWLVVNSFLAIVYSFLYTFVCIVVITHPDILRTTVNQLPVKVSTRFMENVVITMLSFSTILLVHIFWTYYLIRKNKDSIIDDTPTDTE
ncbi:hypothetical protein DXN05_21770 [Deminuibacter soli]|uniref:Uncharacterized protein n=2 Tax=Deminuibacter soli TaxID=2291815 RepID=A0A3E1NDW7_9BACT|nr:hypothetical protein DXN05_21770 [Deminuibacter soli]